MIDLFSDTHTLPDRGMRKAMAEADVGDEQLGEDPTTRRLEERVAEILGMKKAAFLPSGSMCNKVGISALTRPGDAVVCDHRAHLFRSEAGGSAVLSGIVYEPIATESGWFTAEQLGAALDPGSLYQPRTSVVSLEQTHNFAGGTVWPLDEYLAVCDLGRRSGARVHVDGARLFNAVVATGVPADRWAAPADSIWVDFSKGLGGPGGAAIAGSEEFIAEATRFKYMYGGAMRQSGILAAAALHGLEHNLDRLTEDHANAARLAGGLSEVGLAVSAPETNMVYFDPPPGRTLGEFLDALRLEGVRASGIQGRVRMVTHLGVDDAAVAAAVTTVGRVVGGA